MRDSNLELDEVRRLQKQVQLALEHLKAFHLAIGSLMIDVSALRQTAVTSSKAKSRYKNNLAKAMKGAQPIMEEALRFYAEQIDDATDAVETEKVQPTVPNPMKVH